MAEDFKVKVDFVGDASGAVKAAQQAKDAVAGVQQQAAAPIAPAAAPGAEPAKPIADAKKEIDGLGKASAEAKPKFDALVGTLALASPELGRVALAVRYLKDALTSIATLPGAIFTAAALAIGYVVSQIQAANRAMQEAIALNERIRTTEAARRTDVRKTMADMGIRPEVIPQATARTKALEALGYDRGTAARAAALGVEQGLTDQEITDLAAVMKSGQLGDVGITQQEHKQAIRSFRRVIARPAKAEAVANVGANVVAGRQDFFARLERGDRGAWVEFLQSRGLSQADAEKRAGELVGQIQGGPTETYYTQEQYGMGPQGYPMTRSVAQTRPREWAPEILEARRGAESLRRERERIAPNVTVNYHGGVWLARPPQAERRQIANED